MISPCPAELFAVIFSSFEAGIADGITASNLKNRHLPQLDDLIN